MYAEYLQYLKQELSYEVDVLHADNYESLLQVDIIIIIIIWGWPGMSKVPGQVCNIFVTS